MYKDDITRVCTLSNVCWDAVRDQLLFVVDNADAHAQVRRELAACQASTTFAWCKCVMGATAVNVATYVQHDRTAMIELRSSSDVRPGPRLTRIHWFANMFPCRTRDVEAYELLKDETWFLDHYVSSHHFGHWQETVGIFFAALRREDYYHFGRIRNIFLPRMRPPLKEPEQFYLDLALSILSYKTDGVMWCVRAWSPLHRTAQARALTPLWTLGTGRTRRTGRSAAWPATALSGRTPAPSPGAYVRTKMRLPRGSVLA